MPGGCQASLAQRGDRRRFFGRGSHSLRFQQRGDIDRRQRREADQLTAGPDGRQYGIQIGGDQEQDRPIGRFFERFQQRIGRDVIHRIGVVNDRDLPRAGQRTQRQVVTQPLLIVVADDLADGELPLAGFAFDEEIIRMRRPEMAGNRGTRRRLRAGCANDSGTAGIRRAGGRTVACRSPPVQPAGRPASAGRVRRSVETSRSGRHARESHSRSKTCDGTFSHRPHSPKPDSLSRGPIPDYRPVPGHREQPTRGRLLVAAGSWLDGRSRPRCHPQGC